MGALSLVQSDTQTQNDKKTHSPHFFLSKIQGATGCFCLFTARLAVANYETPAALSTGIFFFPGGFFGQKPHAQCRFSLNRVRPETQGARPEFNRGWTRMNTDWNREKTQNHLPQKGTKDAIGRDRFLR
ncbi:MAG: hypothetical protein ABSH15_16545 [Verrucomicrobiota bacterium]|jgi:hypothetical protein